MFIPIKNTLILFFFLILGGASVFGEGAPVDLAAIEAQDDGGVSRAPVTLDGQKLFDVIGVPSYSAEKRAGDISKRIHGILGDPSISTAAINVVLEKDFSVVMVGDRLVMRVFDADSGVPGFTSAMQAEIIKKILADAFRAYREARRPLTLVMDTVLAILVVFLCAALLLGWTWTVRKLNLYAERTLKHRVTLIQSKSFDLIRAGIVWEGLKGFLGIVHVVPIIVVIYFHLGFVLRLFPWTRSFGANFLNLVFDPLKMLGQSFLASIPSLLVVVVVAGLTYVILRMMSLFFMGVHTGTIQISGFDQDWAMPTFRISRLLVVALALVVAYPHIPGSNSLAFKGVSVFLGVILSLGSSSFASNLIAGYSVVYRRAFRVGDWISVDAVAGEVMEILPLVTRLRSRTNEVIIIPNSTIVNSPVTNFSTLARDRGLILHTTVGIGYETPWRQVEAMLLESANRTSGVLKTPKPFVVKMSLGDFAVTYEINAFCDAPQNRLQIYSTLHQNILDVFNENNVQIMTPAYEGDPATPKLVAKENWFTPLAGTKNAPQRTIEKT
ncbi:MAG: mechanosensitive ion channel [Elusimicrobia bacterium]|nr:mechanosensitive ion channel [Elusimicrobiota bacterium]